LEAQARNSGFSDRIHFLGHIRRPFSILEQTDIFVLASHTEPFGLSVQEARQAGCAVVGARVGGIREHLGDGKFGLVVPPGRPDLLAQALARLMTDPHELSRMRRSAVEDLGCFQIERMARDYIRVYQSALRLRSQVIGRT
jgi:glycosyltransferase involved in cell wall biosynthesis